MKLIASVLILALLLFCNRETKAQNQIKDASNAFAHFTKTKDINQLKLARKHIDEAPKSFKDSASAKYNLVRALIYSTLSTVDSNRELSYKNDPLEDAFRSYSIIGLDKKIILNYQSELVFIKNQMAWAYLFEAKNALNYSNYGYAEKAFLKVDSLTGGNFNLYHNLALLNERLGNPDKAIIYFKKIIGLNPQPEYFFSLSNIYSLSGNNVAALEILQEGRVLYPENRDLVFKEINYFADRMEYKNVIKLLPNAFKIDEHQIALNYLAGFSYDMVGNFSKAEEHYEKVLNSDPNNFDANYALGLLCLNLYSRNQDKTFYKYSALEHLSKANEIDQNNLKTLQSLARLYNYTGGKVELKRVNEKINQLKLN